MSAKTSNHSQDKSEGVSNARRILARLNSFTDLRLLGVVVLVMAILSSLSTAFFTTRNLSSVGLYWSFVAMAALGQLFVVIVGGIDLSVGSTMGLSGIVTASVMAGGGNPWFAFALGLAIGLAVGFINGFLSAYVRITSFIVTLATLEIVRGITLGFKQGQAVSGLPDGFLELGTRPILGIPIPIWMMTILAVMVSVVLRRTAQGRDFYAIGSNRVAAGLSGVSVNRRMMSAFAISGFFSALAGLMITARLGSAVPNAGVGMELTVIAAVVIGGASLSGGKGTPFGALLGALLISLVNNALVLLSVPTYWQQTFIGAVILIAAALDLLRRRSRSA